MINSIFVLLRIVETQRAVCTSSCGCLFRLHLGDLPKKNAKSTPLVFKSKVAKSRSLGPPRSLARLGRTRAARNPAPGPTTRSAPRFGPPPACSSSSLVLERFLGE